MTTHTCTRRSVVQSLATVVASSLLPRGSGTPLGASRRRDGTTLSGVGANVRINEVTPELLSRARALGFSWLRTDVRWARVETRVGMFDFSVERRAFEMARSSGFDILAILNYGHPVHTAGRAPASAAERDRFAVFARQAEQSLGPWVSAWEIWNEPNLPQFWPPAPNAGDFVELFRSAAYAIWGVHSDRQLVTGGLSGLDLEYLQRIRPAVTTIAGRGPVAFSLHPYRTTPPETLVGDLSRAGLLDRTGTARTPEGVAIWVTEWGYCRLWAHMDPVRQGEMDVRLALVTAGLGVPVTVLFELVDGGPQTESAYTCGLLHASTLQPHPAAEGWQRAAAIVAHRRPEQPGIVGLTDHWTIEGNGGRLSWGEAVGETPWCARGGEGDTVRVANTLVCYLPTP